MSMAGYTYRDALYRCVQCSGHCELTAACMTWRTELQHQVGMEAQLVYLLRDADSQPCGAVFVGACGRRHLGLHMLATDPLSVLFSVATVDTGLPQVGCGDPPGVLVPRVSVLRVSCGGSCCWLTNRS